MKQLLKIGVVDAPAMGVLFSLETMLRHEAWLPPFHGKLVMCLKISVKKVKATYAKPWGL